jgi:phthalate 4,5-dioxygenase oxygenase subunit
MLSKEDNELLCRVGRGTPMGNLIREYWIPALTSAELPEADGAPLRLRLLARVIDREAQKTTSSISRIRR